MASGITRCGRNAKRSAIRVTAFADRNGAEWVRMCLLGVGAHIEPLLQQPGELLLFAPG
jgi:hypothetical protein